MGTTVRTKVMSMSDAVTRRIIVRCSVVVALAAMNAVACNVPVFRYALERWPPGYFDVTLYRQGPLPQPVQAVADALKETADKAAVNFSLTVVDLPGPTNFPLPWLTVDFPAGKAAATCAWRGPLTPDSGRCLLDSPARRELAKRLEKGDSVVWVLLDGDAATTRLFDTELRKLEKEITIPPPDPSDPLTAGNGDLKIAFSVLQVGRTDPAEAVFVAMLLATDSALTNATGPVAFPVFGRGRELTALTGKDLTAEAIDDVVGFTCGSCSCEVKEQNPGTDLLIAANWDEAIEQHVIQDPPLPALVSLSALAAPTQLATSTSTPPAVAAPSHRTVPATVPATPPAGLRRNLVAVLAIMLGVVALGTLIYLRRPRP